MGERDGETRYLRVGVCEADRGAGFSMHESAQSGFSFDYAVWDTHLTAQSRQEHHQLRRHAESVNCSIGHSNYKAHVKSLV